MPDMELGNILFGNSRGEFSVDRSHQELFYSLMEEIEKIDPNFNSFYGYSSTKYKGKRIGFKNNTFLIRPYYWGDCDCDFESKLEKLSDNDLVDFHHQEDCSLVLSNFEYFPTDYHLDWYKYPLRDSYANQNLSNAEFINMINECIKSLTKGI